MQGYSLMPALTGVGTLTRPAAPLPELQMFWVRYVCVWCVFVLSLFPDCLLQDV